MAEWVRWQLGFGWLQRLQVQTPAETELFLHFFKYRRNFDKNHISRSKKSRGTRIRRQKKILLHEKPFEIENYWFQRVFRGEEIFLTPDSCSSWFFTPRNVVFVKISMIFEKLQKSSISSRAWTCNLWSLPKPSCHLTHSAMRYRTFFYLALKWTITTFYSKTFYW